MGNRNRKFRDEILRVASPYLTRELSEGHPNGAIARLEDANILSVDRLFKDNEEISNEV